MPRFHHFKSLAFIFVAACLFTGFSLRSTDLDLVDFRFKPVDIAQPALGLQQYQHPEKSRYPRTTIPKGAHANGFTILDDLYLRNGTLFVVTSDASEFPARDAMLSAPFELGTEHDLSPTDEHLRFIDPSEAETLLGVDPLYIDEFTAIVWDTPQFMHHYYHWWAEIIFGFWRVYSVLGGDSPVPLPFPDLFLLPFCDNELWRDNAGINGPLMRAARPSVAIESADQWNDFMKLDRTIAFSRVALINREAGHRHPLGGKYFKMISGTMALDAPNGFWEPLRQTILRNFLGSSTVSDSQGLVASEKPQELSARKPIVTYVSRQRAGRHLAETDHQELVRSLMQLQAEGLCEVHIPEMERLSLKQQIDLVSRTTIMVGVHGNGLTHQLWMPPSPRSTVIEIFIPEGFTFDYEILARNVGHRHYAVWNDTFETFSPGTTHEGVNFPEGFHGLEIPVHGPTVADIIRQRLS